MNDDAPTWTCRACGAWRTPACVQCPNATRRFGHAFCRVAWRWRLTVAWSALFAAAALMMAAR